MRRYYIRIETGEAVTYTRPFPCDYSSAFAAATDLLTALSAGDRLLFDCFTIDGIYNNSADRLSDQSRTTDDIGKVYQQDNDESYWTLTGVTPASDGPPAVAYSTEWTEFEPVPPAL